MLGSWSSVALPIIKKVCLSFLLDCFRSPSSKVGIIDIYVAKCAFTPRGMGIVVLPLLGCEFVSGKKILLIKHREWRAKLREHYIYFFLLSRFFFSFFFLVIIYLLRVA